MWGWCPELERPSFLPEWRPRLIVLTGMKISIPEGNVHPPCDYLTIKTKDPKTWEFHNEKRAARGRVHLSKRAFTLLWHTLRPPSGRNWRSGNDSIRTSSWQGCLRLHASCLLFKSKSHCGDPEHRPEGSLDLLPLPIVATLNTPSSSSCLLLSA